MLLSNTEAKGQADVWLVVTVQRHSESMSTEFAMKGSWGHPGIAISEAKKQETGEEVKRVMKRKS